MVEVGVLSTTETFIDGEPWILAIADEHVHDNMPAYRLVFQKSKSTEERIFVFREKGKFFHAALDALKRAIGKVVSSVVVSNHDARLDFSDGSWIQFGESEK